MIVQIPTDAPLLLKAAAGSVLVLHIGGASLGLATGSVAILARKGGGLHNLAGRVFFGAMLSMGLAAAVTAPFIPDRVSAVMGLFVAYLAATAWAVVRRRPGQVGRFEGWAMLAAIGISAAFFSIGLIGGAMPGGVIDHEPSQIGFVAAAIVALAAVSDFRVLRAGGLAGPRRVARHLWRMSLALAIAWGSFAAQPKAQPEAIRGAPWLIIPALVVVGLMAFWMVRVRIVPALRRAARTRPDMAGAAA
ncbi:hypothetical protein [Phenylobacterium sp.]|uniref:hypothetical protein n=1 Tax=Phenylobacterium sp. TaxID=1871053 RepID=UPI002DEBA1A1|nr:hypothetical protein [Phenylobacterium sp.]